MTPIATMVERMMAAGVAAEIITLAVETCSLEVAAAIALVRGHSADKSADISAERRRAADRERKRLSRMSADIPQNSADSADTPSICKNSLSETEKVERKKEKRESAKSACPRTFQPNAATLATAAAAGFTETTLPPEVGRFLDDAAAHNRKYVDWQAAFRKWLTSPYQKGPQSGTIPKTRTVQDAARDLHARVTAQQREWDELFGEPGNGGGPAPPRLLSAR